MTKKVLTFKESPEGVQLHAGRLKGKGDDVWHSDDHVEYWCGSWHHRTYKELYNECLSILRDLENNHPDLLEVEARENND